VDPGANVAEINALHRRDLSRAPMQAEPPGRKANLAAERPAEVNSALEAVGAVGSVTDES
jgi:hypothetical protein